MAVTEQLVSLAFSQTIIGKFVLTLADLSMETVQIWMESWRVIHSWRDNRWRNKWLRTAPFFWQDLLTDWSSSRLCQQRLHLPASASPILAWQACVTTPSPTHHWFSRMNSDLKQTRWALDQLSYLFSPQRRLYRMSFGYWKWAWVPWLRS